MKRLHRESLFAWSVFDPARNIDFNSLCLVRPEGCVLVDPLPLGEHDRAHLQSLGTVVLIVVTNSDHLRASRELAAELGARLAGPRAEGLEGMDPLGEGEEPLPGIEVLELQGSKTPGELALLVDGHTLITGDLVRSHAGGALHLLPAPKLSDPEAALRSLQRLALLPVDAVLVGDGYPVFREGQRALAELAARH